MSKCFSCNPPSRVDKLQRIIAELEDKRDTQIKVAEGALKSVEYARWDHDSLYEEQETDAYKIAQSWIVEYNNCIEFRKKLLQEYPTLDILDWGYNKFEDKELFNRICTVNKQIDKVEVNGTKLDFKLWR